MAWYDKAVFYHMYPLGMTGVEMKNSADGCQNHFPVLWVYIPYLKELGMNAVYIGPLFESASHGYDTIDYRLVDRRLGSNEDFRKFVDIAHGHGIRVIVDAVFNHTGRDFFAFRDLREKGEASKYRNWYKGLNFHATSSLGDPFSYDGWRGYKELPELNFNEQDVRAYLLDVVRFWVDEFDIDGLRLDCADKLDISFQKDLRRLGDSLDREFFLLGEVIHGEYGRWVNDETLHSLTNYELHKSLYSGFNDHNFFEVSHNLNRNLAIAKNLYTFLENHDVDRIASKLQKPKNLKACHMALFTLPGHPSLYYGEEFALEGKKDGYSDAPLRPSILSEGMEPNEFTDFIARLAEIRGQNPELSTGDYKELCLQCKHWAYARVLNGSAVITALNNDEQSVAFVVKLPVSGKKAFDLFTEEEIPIEAGNQIRIKLAANEGRLIKVTG